MANKKVTQDQVEMMKIFRANGMTIRDIATFTGYGLATVQKYVEDIAILPESHQRNPMERISVEASKLVAKARVPTAENRRIAEEIEDYEYFVDTHVSGARFCENVETTKRAKILDAIPLVTLKELMEEPTDYKSPLTINNWFRYYLGQKGGMLLKHKPHTWSDLQMEMLDVWSNNKRSMFETFRAAGKTMVGIGVVTHEVCENRENNYAIASETKYKARQRVKNIGDILLTNKKIIADYGFLPMVSAYKGYKQEWTKESITVKREFKQTDPSLMCFSTESSEATGAHFAGIVFDDVWSRKLEKNSRENKRKWFDWYDGELEGCLEDAWELFLLTRKGVNDLYRELEERQVYTIFKRPAVLKFPTIYDIVYKDINGMQVFNGFKNVSDDYEISSPDRFKIEFFLEKHFKMPEPKWRAEYQLDPIAEKGQFFKWEDLRSIKNSDAFFNKVEARKREKYMRVIGFMDLAFGKSDRADYTALVILGYYNRNYYLLETYLKRGATENDMLHMLQEAHSDFPKYLRMVYIEDDLQQTSVVERLKGKCGFLSIQGFSSRQEQSRLRKEDSGRHDNLEGKQLRILSQLEGLLIDNRLHYNADMKNLKEFKDEIITFPDCRHFDVIDALGNATSIMADRSILIKVISGGFSKAW